MMPVAELISGNYFRLTDDGCCFFLSSFGGLYMYIVHYTVSYYLFCMGEPEHVPYTKHFSISKQLIK